MHNRASALWAKVYQLLRATRALNIINCHDFVGINRDPTKFCLLHLCDTLAKVKRGLVITEPEIHRVLFFCKGTCNLNSLVSVCLGEHNIVRLASIKDSNLRWCKNLLKFATLNLIHHNWVKSEVIPKAFIIYDIREDSVGTEWARDQSQILLL